MNNSLRRTSLALVLLLACSAPAMAQVSIHFNVPTAQIGFNIGGYPTLQRIPGYPVYYAPGVNSNYFFYDGLYWVYERDNWYASSWYNGPWGLVDPYDVPVYVLRVPVRYYRHAPAYFRGWRADAPPRWHEHWGHSWEQRRGGWDRWDRHSAPAPAPLPTYQRQYTRDRYPDAARQAFVQSQNYRYQPREELARRHYEERREHARSAPQPQYTQPQYTPPQQRERIREQRQEVREQRQEVREQRRDMRENRQETRDQRQETREQRQQVQQPQPAQQRQQVQQPQPAQPPQPARDQPQDPRKLPDRNLNADHSGG